jgi:lipid-binding SYLF domain-containing protein
MRSCSSASLVILGFVAAGAAGLGCQPSREPSSAAQVTSATTEQAAVLDRLGEAATVMGAVGPQIPPSVAFRTRCVAVIPAMLEGGLVVGARHGKGFAVCRDSSGWSAPAPVSISGGTIGLQAGLESSDLVMLFTSDDGMQKLLRAKFALGSDASASAGPVGGGREASTDSSFRASVLTYSRSRGLFAGADLGGAVIEQDHDATWALYGSPTDFRTLLSGQMPVPPRASGLLGAVRAAFPPPKS